MQSQIPKRKDIRWKGFDYTSEKCYFITVDVHESCHLLGEVEDGVMRCNAAGQMVYEALLQIQEQYGGTEIVSAVVMPNHVHFMLYNGGGYYIPEIMRWFKSVTTNRYIRGVKEQGWASFYNTFWQRNYFDRVVRDQKEFDNVKRYIEENPHRWGVDEEMGHGRARERGGRTRGYARTVVILLLMLFVSCHAQPGSKVAGFVYSHPVEPFYTGSEMMMDCICRYRDSGACFFAEMYFYTGNGAVVANQTSLVGNTHLVDTLLSHGVHITKIFCPEHGFRGTEAAGAKVSDSKDPQTGLPIISLYGKNKKPTPQQMRDVNCVIFDLQDVGCRFYTYLSTLHYVMEACAEAGIPLVVLDRPNPNGHYIDGPVLDTAHFRSFVGMHPVPIVYGMTIGEYACMINGEHWLAGGRECDLIVVPMQGYKRDSVGYELPVPPSPNLRNAHAIALYPSLCLFEGTNCGVGRGTETPFEIVTYEKDGMDLTLFTPSDTSIHLDFILSMYKRVPKGKFFLKNNFFDRLAGTDQLRRQIMQGKTQEEIRASWQPALEHFKTIRQRYLIYPDFEVKPQR